MKSFATLTAALCLTAAAIQSRACERNTIPFTIGAAQATDHIGKQVTVTGVEAQVSIRPSVVFLNFEKPYPNSPFTAILRSKSTDEFENLSALKGNSVSVKGKVIEYIGKTEIEFTGKSQLRTLGDMK